MDLPIRKLAGPKTKVACFALWGEQAVLLTYSASLYVTNTTMTTLRVHSLVDAPEKIVAASVWDKCILLLGAKGGVYQAPALTHICNVALNAPLVEFSIVSKNHLVVAT